MDRLALRGCIVSTQFGAKRGISWRDVPLYRLDTAKPLTGAQRVTSLCEYRATGGMYLVVMAEPTGCDTPEECDRLSEAGPSVDEIDWTGFEVAS